MKPSRLLQRLDAAIAAARSPLEGDCLRAERAVYLLRLGQPAEAKDALATLHRQYDPRPHVEISVWLNLADGLAMWFADVERGAHDKVQRALALSTAVKLNPLRALSAAWLAQLDYMRHDVEAMARHLREALQLADKTAHSSRSRASLVAAQALYHAGRPDLASVWNTRARQHACEEGDDATVSALMRNMAWLRMVTWRQEILTGKVNGTMGRHVMMGADSTAHYDERVGACTLRVRQPSLHAQILSLQGNASQALELYERDGVNDHSGTTAGLQGNLLADQAWCHVQLGNLEAARRYASLSESGLNPETHIDDRAAAHSRLAQIHAALGDAGEAERQQRLAARAWEANALLQVRVIELLGTLAADGS